MSLYVGIDGGGTKTTCVVGDEASTLAVVCGPGSNVIRLGEEKASAALREVLARACSRAGVSPLRVCAACIGVAGATDSETSTAIRRIASQALPNASVKVFGDMVIAFEAALEGMPGVITISGTGSIAYGRNAADETARAGGWGYRVSDEGSGHWIGHAAVRGVLQALDSGRETLLRERILRQWKLNSHEELVRYANGDPTPNFAELFAVVHQAARERDAEAITVLKRAGTELAILSSTVLHRLWKPDQAVRVALAGGVFENSAEVRNAFHGALRQVWPKAAVCFKITDPVIGALWMARKHGLQTGVH
ncbi:MAG TPA: BadF/BadG/BcrA/BcrD ATPase family protein [Terriglobales bacterium]|nr:BadF/BadG/BcrA/BcrD ATPase family protein [Terriglobales bacterium]